MCFLREPSLEEQLLLALGKVDFGPPLPSQRRTKRAKVPAAIDDHATSLGPANVQVEAGEGRAQDSGAGSRDPSLSIAVQWRAVLDSLAQAREELRVVGDVVEHVEGRRWLAMMNIARPRLQGAELAGDMLLRLARKQCDLRVSLVSPPPLSVLVQPAMNHRVWR